MSVGATTVYLVRHAKAGRRDAWAGPDALRPLTKAGLRQAEALVEIVGGSVARIVSSPYVRCVQTVEPLAEAHGLEVETADELAEGAPAEGALELGLTVAADGPVVLCTHGDVVAFATEELLAAGTALDGPLELKKGSTWVLEVQAGRYVRGRYVPPPPKPGAVG
jgi:8-oxo-dGTP diphosphatase